jgi:A/G-specific adenine glycosylase
MRSNPNSRFSERVVAWQRRHGRHDLPWQANRDPYAIWVSEIMLQQTQVATVIPYYRRFMERFPDAISLADAELDEVMRHWSGLGYYSRARNLHRAARMIVARPGSAFPQALSEIAALPGVGRSTAGAIAALAFGEPHAILDGNVKRVLCRFFGIEGDPRSAAVECELWSLAETLVPRLSAAVYTQGLMDLGAAICVRRGAKCPLCPLRADCIACKTGRVDALPMPPVRKMRPERSTAMLLLCHKGEVLLEKRPPSGIWGGLWSLPEADAGADLPRLCRERFGARSIRVSTLPALDHGFTHFRLRIHPLRIDVGALSARAAEPGVVWLPFDEAHGSALPVAVKRILAALRRVQA